MRTEHINYDNINNVTLIPSSINKAWERRDARSAKYFLGFIRIKKAKPAGFYSTSDYYEEYFETAKELLKEYPENFYNEVYIMRKARVIIRMNNKTEFVEHFDRNEIAETRVAQLKDLNKKLTRLH